MCTIAARTGLTYASIRTRFGARRQRDRKPNNRREMTVDNPEGHRPRIDFARAFNLFARCCRPDGVYITFFGHRGLAPQAGKYSVKMGDIYSDENLLISEAQFARTHNTLGVHADTQAALRSAKQLSHCLGRSFELIGVIAEARPLRRRTTRSSGHRSLRSRLRPTCPLACLSFERTAQMNAYLPTGITRKRPAGVPLNSERWASREAAA